MNEIWRTGKFPEDWHKAVIIPIPKPGKDKTEATNYRPIALTSCICKTIKRMINDRLVWFLESNDLISGNQAGFRKNYRTNDHLVRLESFNRDTFIKKEHYVAIFLILKRRTTRHGNMASWKIYMILVLEADYRILYRISCQTDLSMYDYILHYLILLNKNRESHKGVSYRLLYFISKLITLSNVLIILTVLCMLMISVSFINRKIWRI